MNRLIDGVPSCEGFLPLLLFLKRLFHRKFFIAFNILPSYSLIVSCISCVQVSKMRVTWDGLAVSSWRVQTRIHGMCLCCPLAVTRKPNPPRQRLSWPSTCRTARSRTSGYLSATCWYRSMDSVKVRLHDATIRRGCPNSSGNDFLSVS